MDRLDTKLPLLALAFEVEQCRDDFFRDGSGALMLIRPCHGVPDWLKKKCTWLYAAILEIGELRKQAILHAMINKLPPGVMVPRHTDTLAPTSQGERPRVERWHLPITSNADCLFWDDNFGFTRMQPGSWWGPVPYWREHAVENTGRTERVHLVVDLDTPRRVNEREPITL